MQKLVQGKKQLFEKDASARFHCDEMQMLFLRYRPFGIISKTIFSLRITVALIILNRCRPIGLLNVLKTLTTIS